MKLRALATTDTGRYYLSPPGSHQILSQLPVRTLDLFWWKTRFSNHLNPEFFIYMAQHSFQGNKEK